MHCRNKSLADISYVGFAGFLCAIYYACFPLEVKVSEEFKHLRCGDGTTLGVVSV